MAGGSCFCFLLLLLSIRSILSYNPHATQFTDLKYTVQWLLVFLLSVRPSPQLENIFIPPPPKNSVPSSSCPPCPTSFYETTNNLLSVSADALFGVFCINGLRQYVSFREHLLICFQGSSMLWYEVTLHYFLLPTNIPLYGYATLCLSIHPLMNTLVVSTSCLMMNDAAVSSHIPASVRTYVFISLELTHTNGSSGSRGSSIFDFWGTARLFHSLGHFTFLPTACEGSGSPQALPTYNLSLLRAS